MALPVSNFNEDNTLTYNWDIFEEHVSSLPDVTPDVIDI